MEIKNIILENLRRVYDIIKVLNIVYSLKHKVHAKQWRYGFEKIKYSPDPVKYTAGHFTYHMKYYTITIILISTGINAVKDKYISWKD